MRKRKERNWRRREIRIAGERSEEKNYKRGRKERKE